MDARPLELIRKVCKGKTHIKLTVGALDANSNQTIRVFGQSGELKNENYIYEIGSITKTFTASLLAKQIHEQKMSLDDPISKYVDGLDGDRYYPTLKRLATHTSGYARFLPLSMWEGIKLLPSMLLSGKKQGIFPFHMDLDKMKRLVRENKLQDKDYLWHYSNFAVALLGYAVSVASGRDYKSMMNDFLSNELSLSHSYTGTSASKNLHGFNRKNKDIGNWVWGKDLTAPAGDISSTAKDLLEYARINMYDEKPYLALCHQKHASAKGHDMGLGWIMSKSNNHILWHNGGTGAFRSFLAFDKEKKLATVALVNYPSSHIDIEKIGSTMLENLQKGVTAID